MSTTRSLTLAPHHRHRCQATLRSARPAAGQPGAAHQRPRHGAQRFGAVAPVHRPSNGFAVTTSPAAGTEVRGYHNVAMLLPDGRVLVASGRDARPEHLLGEAGLQVLLAVVHDQAAARHCRRTDPASAMARARCSAPTTQAGRCRPHRAAFDDPLVRPEPAFDPGRAATPRLERGERPDLAHQGPVATPGSLPPGTTCSSRSMPNVCLRLPRWSASADRERRGGVDPYRQSTRRNDSASRPSARPAARAVMLSHPRIMSSRSTRWAVWLSWARNASILRSNASVTSTSTRA